MKTTYENIPNYTGKTNKTVYTDKKLQLRACPFCGGEAKLFFTPSGDSASIVCGSCQCRLNYRWLGADGQNGMVDEMQKRWNYSIYDEPLASAKTQIERKNALIQTMSMSEADIMAECYKRLKPMPKRRYDLEHYIQ